MQQMTREFCLFEHSHVNEHALELLLLDAGAVKVVQQLKMNVAQMKVRVGLVTVVGDRVELQEEPLAPVKCLQYLVGSGVVVTSMPQLFP